MTTELFHFKGRDGGDFTLPKQIPAGALRKSRNAADPVDQVFTVLESCASPEALGALDELDLVEFTRVTNEWMQGMKPGESSPSSN